MDDKDTETQARAIVGHGLARELGQSRATVEISNRPAGRLVAVLLINVVVGGVFYSLGAWPVLAFCGLDVLLVYWAFNANYRAGRLSETIDVTPAMMTLTRRLPTGSREHYEFNPYWVRVRLYEKVDGRNELRLASHGEEFMFAKFLSDDERRDFAESLTGALLAARTARQI
jgi:uncharacterized membrane protein